MSDKHETELTYQPIVSLAPERPPVLALHTRAGGRSAHRFCGALRQAFDDRKWLATTLRKAAHERVGANLYLEVLAERLVRNGREVLVGAARTPMEKKRLIVEIGGREIVPNQALADVLDELRFAGIRIAVATEYSHASHQLLLETHPDYLRISDYVVRDCAADFHRRAVLEATMHLAWKLGSAVIADGVANKDDLGTLRSLGVDYAEGGHLCAPLPFDEAIRWAEEACTKTTRESQERSEEGR